MNFVQEYGYPGLVLAGIVLALSIVASLAFTIGPLLVLYYLLTLPMRRNERARLFLDLLELGMRDGHTPETTVVHAAGSGDPVLGRRFRQLAAAVQVGNRLGQALAAVPYFLPPKVAAIIRGGERIGDIRKVLPACRQVLADGVSHVHGALNYVLVLAFGITPVAVILPIVIKHKVMPVFEAVFEGLLEGTMLPAFTRLVFATDSWLMMAVATAMLLLWVMVLLYVGGPRLRGVFRGAAPGLVDRFLYAFPWRRKRIQRDFSCMLALLLDAGVPEVEAVRIAGDSADNLVLKRRAEFVIGQLSKGVKLPDAIASLDRSREMQWRLTNALHRGRGFLQALSGWHESLAARAFQQEQTAAQLLTTALVLFNGLVVASIVIAVFLALVALTQAATLW